MNQPLSKPKRVAAVDVLRAITMTLMLFVNDFAGIPDIPYWLHHAKMTEDMMGFSDVVFPAFIFCMGMSVVLAIDARYSKGDSSLAVISHIFWRTVALIVMGLFTLNCSSVGVLSYNVFVLLMVLGFFLVWGVYPRCTGWKHHLITALKTIGVLLLAALVLYKDVNGQPFRTGWWGILGLIGFTYAVCAVIYIFARKSYNACLIAWGVLLVLMLGGHSELIPYDYATRVVWLTFIPGDMTQHFLGFSGVMTILTIRRFGHNPSRMLGLFATAGVAMLVAGLLSHPYWIISKILATPTWGFFCLAMFFPASGFLYWLCDMRGKSNWFNIIRPAGTATLTCYIIPYVWYSVMGLFHLHYPALFNHGYTGLVRSAIFAIVVVMLTGLLSRAHIKLKV
ncbi:MAG: DUF5009 domain-containing protein [Muribaculaceae bacterium]|nr:DUF5009 domain-containing protein [Muribaculaceae bacterium]